MDINKEREKLFSKLYNFEYVCFDIGDSYMISKYMQDLDSENYKKPILNKYINSEINKLPINLIHNNENKYYESSMRFRPKVIFDYNYYNILIPKDCVSESDVKYICSELISFLRKIITSLVIIEQNNLKTINDVIYTFNHTNDIAISNKLFKEKYYDGYIFKKPKILDLGPRLGYLETKEYYEIYGRDSKDEFYICDSDRLLENQFNTPIYDNNWYIFGLFIDGILHRFDSNDDYDE